LEKAGKVTAVLFDKTGTLTTGKPSVVKTWQLEIRNPNDPSSVAELRRVDEIRKKSELQAPQMGRTLILALAAALAKQSSHPISQAVAALAPGGFELTDWQEVPG